jgi:hypothetical protein
VALKREDSAVGEKKDVKVTVIGAVWWVALKREVTVIGERKDVRVTLIGTVCGEALKREVLRMVKSILSHLFLIEGLFSGFERDASMTCSGRNLLPCSCYQVGGQFLLLP